MSRLSCGVAIITYNGLRYLPEQLDSITSQTKLPDHIVISDDCSTDGTWQFVEDWAKTTSIPTTLIRNTTQQGLARNFEISVRALATDLIFSCDQDDIWYPDKIEVMCAIMENSSEITLAHSDALLVDSTGVSLNMTLFDGLEVTQKERDLILQGQAFGVLYRRNLVTGATAVFRKELVTAAFPQPPMTYHDAWLALCAAAMGKVYMVERSTIKYRQHGANLVGVRRVKLLTRMRHLWWMVAGPKPLKIATENILSYRKAIKEKLASFPSVPDAYMLVAEEGLGFAAARNALEINSISRALNVVKLMSRGNYKRFSFEPNADIVRDLLNR